MTAQSQQAPKTTEGQWLHIIQILKSTQPWQSPKMMQGQWLHIINHEVSKATATTNNDNNQGGDNNNSNIDQNADKMISTKIDNAVNNSIISHDGKQRYVSSFIAFWLMHSFARLLRFIGLYHFYKILSMEFSARFTLIMSFIQKQLHTKTTPLNPTRPEQHNSVSDMQLSLL